MLETSGWWAQGAACRSACRPCNSLPRAERHHDFFERAVAGPLADAVDGALDLAGAVFDAGEAVGHGQAEIVVAVDADHRAVDVRHALDEGSDDVAEVRRRGVADGVGNVDRRRAGVDRGFDDLAEEVELGARGVFGRELDVVAVAARRARRPPPRGG